MNPRKSKKDQSAMEYLLTYGWSILILAVVLATLFALGIFGNPHQTFSCLGDIGFLCSNPRLGSSGALTINISYGPSNYPITITGLSCNVTAASHPPSVETVDQVVEPGQSVPLEFQCPLTNTALFGTNPIILWIYYNTPAASGEEVELGRGVMTVGYKGIVWNVTEWTSPNDCAGNGLLPYSDLTANPAAPSGVTNVITGQWSTFTYGSESGWAYSTDYHDHDVYYGLETILFPFSLLSADSVCNSAIPSNDPHSHGYTATSYLTMSGSYTFNVVSDDGTEIFYRPASGGSWVSVFNGAAWQNQAPKDYISQVTFTNGKYEIAADFIDTGDPAGLSVVTISPPPSQS